MDGREQNCKKQRLRGKVFQSKLFGACRFEGRFISALINSVSMDKTDFFFFRLKDFLSYLFGVFEGHAYVI
jgi:hypothetical protein